jgi:nucleoside-triphosphatase
MRVIRTVDRKFGGMFSAEIREGGIRRGFKIVDIATGKEGILAHVNQKTGPRLGKYRINLPGLEEIGVKAIESALAKCDITVIDEIGPMELKSEKFIKTVRKAFESERNIIATIHYKSRHSLVEEIKTRKDVIVYEINENNRDSVRKEIVERLS